MKKEIVGACLWSMRRTQWCTKLPPASFKPSRSPPPPLGRSTPADIAVRGAELANSDDIYLQGIEHNADIDPVIAVAADNGPVAAAGGVRAINSTGAPTDAFPFYAQSAVCRGFFAEQEEGVTGVYK